VLLLWAQGSWFDHHLKASAGAASYSGSYLYPPVSRLGPGSALIALAALAATFAS
jgi:hypothetical protein